MSGVSMAMSIRTGLDRYVELYKVAQNSAEAAIMALKAGIDVEASDICYAELANLIGYLRGGVCRHRS